MHIEQRNVGLSTRQAGGVGPSGAHVHHMLTQPFECESPACHSQHGERRSAAKHSHSIDPCSMHMHCTTLLVVATAQ